MQTHGRRLADEGRYYDVVGDNASIQGQVDGWYGWREEKD